MSRWSALLCVGLCLIARGMPVSAEEPTSAFPLRDGDVWVMAGDSITAQHLHSNYFEAFCFARYPQLTFAFRNSGVGGHTIPTTLARFDYDVAAWKPTVVSVELGMNDAGRYSTQAFMDNMRTWIERVRSIGARPVLFAPSPVNDGTTMDSLRGRNQRLEEYSTEIVNLAQAEKIPVADQFHAIVDVWGKNKPQENLARLVESIRPVFRNEDVAGVEHLQAFVQAQDAQKQKPISMQGDPVHPGPCGQLMMAAALLKGLNAEGFVSSVSIDADGKKIDAKGCTVSNVQAQNGVLKFDRLDESLPFPIPAQAAAVLPLAPSVLELSQYTLQVNGLSDGVYSVKLNGVEVARLSAEQLQAGVNLTPYGEEMLNNDQNPLAVQSQAILSAVSAKEGVVGQWRGLSKRAHEQGAAPELQDQLKEKTAQVEAADQKIRDAAKPQTIKVEILPVAK